MNRLLAPDAFDNAAWTKSAATVAPDAAAVPGGALIGDLLQENTANSQHSALQSVSVPAGVATFSVLAKLASGTRRVSLYPQNAGTAWAVFNLQTATRTLGGGSNYIDGAITAQGDGWYQLTVRLNVVAGTLIPHIYMSNADAAAAPIYAGDGASGFYLARARLTVDPLV